MGRRDVTFVSHGTECAAWLYEPEGAGPHPILVMAHGFSATRDQRLDVYAEHFRAAGIGVLLFDYRHFGASGGEPRQLLDVRRQHADFRAALTHARGVEWVDPSRVGLFGSSFSGGHVIAVAARDGRVAAVVSQCPFTDGLASLAPMGVKNLALATAAGVRDQVGALVGRAPHYIPAVGPPGSFAVMTAPDAQPGFANITDVGSGWVNRVAGRVALRVGLYRPGRVAARVNCPILFCVCDQDSVAPATRTLKWAARAPRGEVKRYPVGHFEIYVGEPFAQAIADQTEFLERTLTPSRSRERL
jgi:pimeloyl-ACP methyl ester carboxylesterase